MRSCWMHRALDLVSTTGDENVAVGYEASRMIATTAIRANTVCRKSRLQMQLTTAIR